jgi:hypothetical protein
VQSAALRAYFTATLHYRDDADQQATMRGVNCRWLRAHATAELGQGTEFGISGCVPPQRPWGSVVSGSSELPSLVGPKQMS